MTAARHSTELELDGPLIRQILETITELHEYVFVLDEDLRAVWASQGLADLYNGPNRVLGVSLRSLIPADPELTTLLESLASPAAAGAARLRLGSPGAPLVDLSVFRMRWDAPFIVVVARPVDQELRSTRDAGLLTRMLDNAADAVIAIEVGGFITYANTAAAALLERRRSELIGRPVAAFLSRASGLVEIIKHLRAESVNGREIELLREDGTSRWISVSANRLRIDSGRSAGSVVFLRDITASKRVETELARKNEELESYVSNVSHDLRSPLVSVRGFARLLREDYQHLLDKTGLHFLGRIEEAGRSMEALVEDLLELSRIGQAEEPHSLVDPRGVLRQVEADLKLEIDAHNIILSLPDKPPMIRCNRTRLYQLFSNLISNAVAHMGPTDSPRIDVDVRDRPSDWEISVCDNGRGIDADQREQVFEVFTTLGARSDGRKSSGMGLAIVRKIAATHAGEAFVQAGPDGGADFRVRFARS